MPGPERLVVNRHLADGSDSRTNVDVGLTEDVPTWVCIPGDVPHLRGGWNGHGAGGSSRLDGCVTAVVRELACLWVEPHTRIVDGSPLDAVVQPGIELPGVPVVVEGD